MAGNSPLIDQDQVKQKVEELWAKVFLNSNEVIRQHTNHGFNGVKNGNPGIEQRIFLLHSLEAILDLLLAHAPLGELDYEQQRQILNAKQQINNMELVAAAVKANAHDDYVAAVEALERQLPI
jgi:ABC-type lipoprotein export system ATPase subunit